MQMIFPGKAIYGPAQVAVKALTTLSRISALHKATNSFNLSFYPIPVSKRIMSDADHLSIFSQLLLCNDAQVVETSATVLKSLVEYNPVMNSKLYLTGTSRRSWGGHRMIDIWSFMV